MRRGGFRCGIVALAAIILAALPAKASHELQSGKTIKGYEYSHVFGMWVPRRLSVWVQVDDELNQNIIIKAETSRRNASVKVNFSKKLHSKLTNTLTTYLKLAKQAAKSKVDQRKGLGCYGFRDEYNLCNDTGSAFRQGQFSFNFISVNKGSQTSLVIDIYDDGYYYNNASIYFGPVGGKKLLTAIKGIGPKLSEAKALMRKELEPVEPPAEEEEQEETQTGDWRRPGGRDLPPTPPPTSETNMPPSPLEKPYIPPPPGDDNEPNLDALGIEKDKKEK